MQMTIIIAFRPTQGGGGTSHQKEGLIQDEDGSWNSTSVRHSREDIERCLKSIYKNSAYKHNIIIATDADVHFNEKWLKSVGDNVIIHQGDNLHIDSRLARLLISCKEIILSLPDDIILCYGVNADCIFTKNWDIPIIEAYKKHGDNHVYVPMFVEPRTVKGRSNLSFMVTDPKNGENLKKEIIASGVTTVDKIWNEWRRTICCHSLTILPPLDKGYFEESDLDNYIKIASQFNRDIIDEGCGVRGYGYWVPAISKSIRFQQLFKTLDVMAGGADFLIDNNIPVKSKMVVTKSYVFHLHVPCKLDDIEVDHV